MKKIEKAIKMLEEFNYQATIVNDKLYITSELRHAFQLSEEEIDKWAAEYNTKRRVEFIEETREDLIKIYETITATGKEEFYELEYHESFPIKTLLSNIDCALDELNKL